MLPATVRYSSIKKAAQGGEAFFRFGAACLIDALEFVRVVFRPADAKRLRRADDEGGARVFAAFDGRIRVHEVGAQFAVLPSVESNTPQ